MKKIRTASLFLLMVLGTGLVPVSYTHLAAQLDNRRAVAAVSGQVPETLHNIRTIRALGLESYRERRYDRCIGESLSLIHISECCDLPHLRL